MKKAILVIDMPKCCNQCPICATYQQSSSSVREYWCPVNGNDVEPLNKPPHWCPLKELPQKDNDVYFEDYDKGYRHGWNACIDKISR